MASRDYVRDHRDVASVHIDIDTEVSILEIGIKFSYQVPSFLIVVVDLRKIKVQLMAQNGSLLFSDGFIKADQSLEAKTVPFSIKIKDFCFVPVSRVLLYVHVYFISIMHTHCVYVRICICVCVCVCVCSCMCAYVVTT